MSKTREVYDLWKDPQTFWGSLIHNGPRRADGTKLRVTFTGEADAILSLKNLAAKWWNAPNQKTKRETDAKKNALKPLLRECYSMAMLTDVDGNRLSKGKGYERTFALAYEALCDPYSGNVDEDLSEIAVRILSSGVLGEDLPKPKTMQGWYSVKADGFEDWLSNVV